MNNTSTTLRHILGKLLVFCALSSQAQTYNTQWAKGMGSPNNDRGFAVTLDNNNNVVHAGAFEGTIDFDPGSATSNLTSITGGVGGFVSKLDPSGNFAWAQAIPGAAYAVTSDVNGNIFVAGTFNGTQDFDPGSGTLNFTAASTQYTDIYISKFDNSGNFLWAKWIGGNGLEGPQNIKTDANGNVFLCGNFTGSVDFDPSATTNTFNSKGSQDGYILKLDASGNYVWAATFGSSYSGEQTYDIAIDANGDVIASGMFSGTVDFDPGTGTNNVSTGGINTYLLKLTNAGAFVWVKSIGNTLLTEGHAVAVDNSNNVFLAGIFGYSVDFDPSATATATLASNGNSADGFIAKYDANGNYEYAKNFGGTGNESCTDIDIDATGKIYIVGYYSGTSDFDPSPTGTFTIASTGSNDSFISVLDANGNFLWAGDLQPTMYDYMMGVKANSTGDFYISGSYLFTTDFDMGSGVMNLSGNGGHDIFIMKLGTGSVGIKEYNSLQSKVTVFPNPTSNLLTISLTDAAFDNIQIIITDIAGRELTRLSFNHQTSVSMDLSGYAEGIYFYQLQQHNQTLAGGKIIKQ